MINDKADEVIEERFQSFFSRYQIGFETSVKGCDFTFESVPLLYYKCDKISFKLGSLYIDSPNYVKNKKQQ